MNGIAYILVLLYVLLQDLSESALVGGAQQIKSVDSSIMNVLKSEVQKKDVLPFIGMPSAAKLELSDPFSFTGTQQVVAGVKYDLNFKITAKLVCYSAGENCKGAANRGPITFQCSATFVDAQWKKPRFEFIKGPSCQ